MFFLLVYGRVHNTTRFYATASQSIIKGERSNSTNSMLDHYSGNIKTVGQLIGAASSFMPDKDIYHHVEAGDKWTYKEAHNHITAISRGLPEGRVLPGKVFVSAQFNDSENLALRLGALQAGVIPAHVDIKAFNENTILSFLDAVQPRSLFITPKDDVDPKLQLVDLLIPEIPRIYQVGFPLKIQRFPDLKVLFHSHKSKSYNGWCTFRDILMRDETPSTVAPATIKPDQIAEYHFPRFNNGVCYDLMKFTHESVVQSAINWGSVGPFNQKRVLFTGSFSHPEVMTSMLSCYAYGSYFVGSTYWFRPSNTLRDLAKEHCSVLVTTPEHLKELINHPLAEQTKFHLETLLVINTPHSMVSTENLKKAKDLFKLNQVETAFIADGCMSPFLHNVVTETSGDKMLGSPIVNTEVKIIDEDGKILPTGSSGNLLTRGTHTMKLYSGKNSEQVLDSDGWLNTGVKAAMNENGTLTLTQRRKKRVFSHYTSLKNDIRDKAILTSEAIRQHQLEAIAETERILVSERQKQNQNQ